MMRFVCALLMVASAGAACAQDRPATENLRDGDIIFQESFSSQAAAIREVQGDSTTHVGIVFRRGVSWSVLEAVSRVRYAPLESWIGRGGQWRVMRVRGEFDAARLRRVAESYLGRPYDLRFEWTEQRIYCSELVYKAYAAVGIRLGEPEDWSTLALGPRARALLQRRGGTRPTGPIVTVAHLMSASQLVFHESGNGGRS